MASFSPSFWSMSITGVALCWLCLPSLSLSWVYSCLCCFRLSLNVTPNSFRCLKRFWGFYGSVLQLSVSWVPLSLSSSFLLPVFLLLLYGFFVVAGSRWLLWLYIQSMFIRFVFNKVHIFASSWFYCTFRWTGRMSGGGFCGTLKNVEWLEKCSTEYVWVIYA